MPMFVVKGPFEIPVQKLKAGRRVDRDALKAFWKGVGSRKNRIGCYVFAMRAGKGMTPIYVGKTTKSFEAECFQQHKLGHYDKALLDYRRGTPVMFLVVLPKAKGKPPAKVIDELETFLIQVGYARNNDLANIKKKKTEPWGITGLLRSGPGKATNESREFKKLMKL